MALVAPAADVDPFKAWAVLPGDGERPAPSLDLQAELDGDIVEPAEWGTWKVDAIDIIDPPAMLAALPRKDLDGDRRIRIGHDLRFWGCLTEDLVTAVRHHEYLPAIFVSRAQSKRPRGRRRKKPDVNFEVGWELADSAMERILDRFERSMPAACAALRSGPPAEGADTPAVADSRSLLASFLAVGVMGLVRTAKVTKAVATSFGGSFPAQAIPAAGDSPDRIDTITWSQWKKWRDRIQRSSLDADERVCFRLVDAPSSAPDAWRLEWLLTSRRDPSLQVPLSEFWGRDRLVRPSSRSVREVLLQLGQAARLYPKLWAGMDSDAPNEVALDRESALDFLKMQAPVLQGAGFRVIVPSWWTVTGQRRLRIRLTSKGQASASSGSQSPGTLGFGSLVDFDAQAVLDGEPISRDEWERIVTAKKGLVQLRGEWMELQEDEMARLEEFWEGGDPTRQMTVAEVLREAASANGAEVVLEGDAGRLLARLRGDASLDLLDQPDGFVGTLRGYQVRGFSWLAYLEMLGFGACLADDMGLGKTVQVIAAIQRDRELHPDAGPTLLVAPTSVLGNWLREVRRFAPSLVTFLQHGPDRPRSEPEFRDSAMGADIVVASFAVARLDAGVLSKTRWRRLVVDESQYAKNPSAAVTKALRHLRADYRIALTGTPVENRPMDLWSLFSIINPGYLGTMADFRKNVERPIMKSGDRNAVTRLKGMVQPFILRRMKTDKSIIKDLPDKVEQNAICGLTTEQASLYEAVVREAEDGIGGLEGIERQGLVLSTMMRLKQICNHPAQFLQDGSDFRESRSQKLARVCEMLDEIEAEGESALVFTQFAELGKSLEKLFRNRYSGPVYYLHGGTPRARREHMVEEFQDERTERAIFLLSLRAGGTGITLTRANHVIHFDRWWNPAVENQATDRAYRIGQEKRVLVHKMVTMGTLEERIDALIESKRQLAEDIVGSGESWLAELDNETFRDLIALDRSGGAVG